MGSNLMYIPKTKDISIEFDAMPSGDHQSFCWDVSKEDFKKIKGVKPKKENRSYYNKGLYRIYPDDFFGIDPVKCKMKIDIKVLK